MRARIVFQSVYRLCTDAVFNLIFLEKVRSHASTFIGATSSFDEVFPKFRRTSGFLLHFLQLQLG